MQALEGKVALITGAGSGIGRAVVKRYLDEGAKVCAMDLSVERLNRLQEDFGSKVLVVSGNVADMEANRQAVARTVEVFGRLDIFVGNAGVFDNKLRFADIPAEKLESAYNELFGVNIKGYLFGAKCVLPELMKTGGCMIFTASISSFTAGFGGTLYVSSKHAVAGFVRQLAHELAAERIRVNAVAPGYVPTNLHGLQVLNQGLSPASPEALTQKLPMHFVPETEDYTGLYVLLASGRDARVITGQILLADSGLSVRG